MAIKKEQLNEGVIVSYNIDGVEHLVLVDCWDRSSGMLRLIVLDELKAERCFYSPQDIEYALASMEIASQHVVTQFIKQIEKEIVEQKKHQNELAQRQGEALEAEKRKSVILENLKTHLTRFFQ